jgi:hypothetical protein
MAGSLLILALVPATSALADDSPYTDPFATPLPGGFAKSPLNPHTCQVRNDIPKGSAVIERWWCDNGWVGDGNFTAASESVLLHNTNTGGVAECELDGLNKVPGCLKLMQQMYDADSALPDWPPPDSWQVAG